MRPPMRPHPVVARLVALYAVGLGAAGAALLFAPEWVVPDGDAVPLVQTVGAALLGFAAANWAARGMHLGGIYGRPVVVGNQTFAFVAALVLIAGWPPQPSLGYTVVVLLLTCGAALYSVLLFRPPALPEA